MRLMHERIGQAISYIPDAEGNFPSPFYLSNPLSSTLYNLMSVSGRESRLAQ